MIPVCMEYMNVLLRRPDRMHVVVQGFLGPVTTFLDRDWANFYGTGHIRGQVALTELETLYASHVDEQHVNQEPRSAQSARLKQRAFIRICVQSCYT
jgi:hypothetical protein